MAFFLSSILIGLTFATHGQSEYLEFGPSASKYAVGNLPNITFSLPASWAGQIPLHTTNYELSFWLFEAQGQKESENLIIWLNGEPGCSSLAALYKENGPLKFREHSKPFPNDYSWTKLANVLYLDQPMGTRYSQEYHSATSIDDFLDFLKHLLHWLRAFYDIFPSLMSKNTYFMGELYAGIAIPYFTIAILANNESLPINVKGIAIGNGIIDDMNSIADITTNTFLYQHQKMLRIPQSTFQSLYEIDKICGYTDILQQLTYPPRGKFPYSDLSTLDNRCRTSRTADSVWDTFDDDNCIAWTCTSKPDYTCLEEWLNLPAVREAIHAPSEDYTVCKNTIDVDTIVNDVELPVYKVIPAILEAGIEVHIYSGDYSPWPNHLNTEIAIQNMTWKGHQGLENKPNTAFVVDGKTVGYWGAERGLSYHRILEAGQMVTYDRPVAMFAFVRDVVIGYEE